MIQKRAESEMGAVLLETAVLFPLFLFGVLLFMWIGTIFNAKSALTNAVSRSVRLAMTRSDEKLVGGHLINDLEDFIIHGSQSDRFKSLLSREVDWSTAEGNYATFNSVAGLSDVPAPAEYVYSLVYLYEYLGQSLSGKIRYPCDPTLPTSDEPPAGAGCINCIFAGDGKTDFGLSCRYQPDVFLLTPMVRLLQYLAGDSAIPQIIIKRELTYSNAGN